MGSRWDPWQALAARGPTTELAWLELAGGGAWQRDGLGDLIVLDPRLSRRDRRAVLAHELVHAERGIGRPAATVAQMVREEVTVRREVARRLVPLAELRRFVDSRCEVEAVDAASVSERFDVPMSVAAVALERAAGVWT